MYKYNDRCPLFERLLRALNEGMSQSVPGSINLPVPDSAL